jgi:hypothetical protein
MRQILLEFVYLIFCKIKQKLVYIYLVGTVIEIIASTNWIVLVYWCEIV